MTDTSRRRAVNEAVFRQVNESMATLQQIFAVTEHQALNIVCECDRIDCAERLSVTVETYERVRSDSTLFVVRPGHEDASIEDVMDSTGHYLVVRKHPGEPQEIPEQTDPRVDSDG